MRLLLHHSLHIILCVLLLVQHSDSFTVARPPPKVTVKSGGTGSGDTSTPATTASKCRAISGNVTDNMIYTDLCASSCYVVVNHVVDDPVVCIKWSMYASWDGSHCFARCEAMGGVLVNRTVCTIRDSVLAGLYNKTGPAVALSVVPVACGTWMGVLDSARFDSWYNSPCFSILTNRSSPNINISACGASVRTTGCRVMETKQQWVDECRLSNSTQCGVKVPCPAPNPCGLGSKFIENLIGDKNGCQASSRLVVNISVDANSSCTDWTDHAFRYNGYCVSACDNTADECVLDRKRIQPCLNLTLGHPQLSLCYVAMPFSVETGLRNAFYGLTANSGFECNYRVLPQNFSFIQTDFSEGLWISDEFPSYALPDCNGNVTMDCRIRWPCPPPAPYVYVIPKKECGFLRISQLMYESMGVYDCGWPLARDAVTVILWWAVVSLVWIGVSERHVRPDVTKSLLVLLALGLVVVWEFTIALIFVCYVVVAIFPSLSPDKYFPSPLEDWGDWRNWGYDILSLDSDNNDPETSIQPTRQT
jgi:hypothetical protein